MYRNNRREGHDSIGTTTPATDYYLAEGAVGYDSGYTTYVLVQNPQSSSNRRDHHLPDRRRERSRAPPSPWRPTRARP